MFSVCLMQKPQIFRVVTPAHGDSGLLNMRAINPAVFPSDFLEAGDLQSLPFLDGTNVVSPPGQKKSARILLLAP